MNNLLDGIEEILLMGPGPSCVHPLVYEALGKSTLGHMDPYFMKIMDGIKALLQDVLETKNDLTLPVSGTGSAGMETCFVNLIEPGDRVLVLINGVFGRRMQDVASRLGAEVDVLEFEWGKPVEPDAVRKALAAKEYKILALVHAETSTGVMNPAEEISALVRGTDTLFLLDGVTSTGGIPVRLDAWGVDAFYAGSQKCLSCPPGLAPVSFSPRAVETIRNRTRKVPNWYLDMTMIMNYWGGNKRVYHHTAPINMLYGLYAALLLIAGEGKENAYRRHRQMHDLLVTKLEALGLEMLVEPAWRLPMLNAVRIPAGADDEKVRSELLTRYKIEIGAGLGPLAGKIWRIGLMGHTAREENVNRVVDALTSILH